RRGRRACCRKGPTPLSSEETSTPRPGGRCNRRSSAGKEWRTPTTHSAAGPDGWPPGRMRQRKSASTALYAWLRGQSEGVKSGHVGHGPIVEKQRICGLAPRDIDLSFRDGAAPCAVRSAARL